jgi:cell division protein FtsQ
MSTRTLRRGAPVRRPPVKARGKPKPSRIDWLLAKLPVSEAALRKAATIAMLTVGGVALSAGAVALGVPAMVGEQLGEAAGRAGFRVEQIEITGLKRMDRMSVYAVALDQQSRALPLVDLEAVRQKLLRYGWIADAHVSRRLPDTLLVDIVERQPAAVWQDQGRLTLIDKDGVLLGRARIGRHRAIRRCSRRPRRSSPGCARRPGSATGAGTCVSIAARR